MAKNRDKQKENKKKGKEEQLSRYNEYGIKDLTPYNAIRVMQKKEIVYR